MVKVLVKRLNSKVKLPEYKTSGSSGMDLMASTDRPIKIAPNTLELIPTGLSIAIPEDLDVIQRRFRQRRLAQFIFLPPKLRFTYIEIHSINKENCHHHQRRSLLRK